MGFKYIVIDNGLQLLPVIFPDTLCHIDVASAVLKVPGVTAAARVASAGFILLTAEHCGGDSETLGIASSPEDLRLIDTYEYLHGVKL